MKTTAALLVALASLAPALGDVPSHLAYRVSTPLQARLVGNDADVFVAIDATRPVDRDALLSDLKEVGGTKVSLRYEVTEDALKDLTPQEKSRLQSEIESEARAVVEAAGAKLVGSGTTFHGSGFDWKIRVTEARAIATEGRDQAEPAYGDGTVTVFPVRTPLSVYSTHGAWAVAFVAPGAEDPATLERSIAAAMKEGMIEPRGFLYFYFRLEGGDADRSLVEAAGGIARRLGFDGSSTTVTTVADPS